MASLDSLPDEILRIIAQLIYLDHLPRSLFRCLDPHGLPSTYADGRLISSTQKVMQKTLHAMCLTNSRLYHAARPLLWRRLQITLPYSFMLLLRSLGASRLAEAFEEQYRAQTSADFAKTHLNDQMRVNDMIAAVGLARAAGEDVYVTEEMRDQHQDAVDLVWTEKLLPGSQGIHKSVYHVTLRHDDAEHLSEVHRYPRVLDFSTFHTQGLRRTIDQGNESRFVTPSKLLALITASSEGLMGFGASSNMDSALTLQVLEALLFRDGAEVKSTRRHLRGVSVEKSRDRLSSRRKRLESLDLCGCVSRHFEAALGAFVEKHLQGQARTAATLHEEDGSSTSDNADEDEGRGRQPAQRSREPQITTRTDSAYRTRMELQGSHRLLQIIRSTRFESVRRLGLSGIYFSTDLITPFVCAFPKLTHLDLSGTKADAKLLQALAKSFDLELESLSLARCARLTSASLVELLVDSTVCASLLELSLECNPLQATPLLRADLEAIVTEAPFMRSGSLRYLDLSGCGVDDSILAMTSAQPSLLDIALNASPRISLAGVAAFLLQRAPNVQILELVDSCEAVGGIGILQLNSALLEPCCTTPRLSISEQLAVLGFTQSAAPTQQVAASVRVPAQAKTNLRVLGLKTSLLQQIPGVMGSWSVIFGAGRRGWLVDVTSGPNPEAIDEDLEGDDLDEVDVVSITSPNVGRQARSDSMDRGRQSRLRGPVTWEPETPPRRSSQSRSMSRKRGLPDSSPMERHRSQHSRSRSRHWASPDSRAGVSSSRSQLKESTDEADNVKVQSEDKLLPRAEVIRGLGLQHPRRLALERLSRAKGHVNGSIGWHSKKMEILLGMGMLGRESGSYAYTAYQA